MWEVGRDEANLKLDGRQLGDIRSYHRCRRQCETRTTSSRNPEFLEAVRTGSDNKAIRLLSTVAREKTASLNKNVTPAASDTAHFTVGKVDYVGDYGRRVACTWTDLDEEGKPITDTAVWVLRRESEGWRIAGVAAKVFPDHDPIILNFEDPEDLLKQQQWVRTEMQRRMEESGLQAKETGKTDSPATR